MLSIMNVIPFLVFILWLAAFVYVIVLATRLVKAVEQIARVMTQPESPKP